jgi:fatty acid/phospholipid biosynthesis enzyme
VIRVAVDAMGGDRAPQAEIAGVIEALASLPDEFLVQLVGRRDVIEPVLAN